MCTAYNTHLLAARSLITMHNNDDDDVVDDDDDDDEDNNDVTLSEMNFCEIIFIRI